MALSRPHFPAEPTPHCLLGVYLIAMTCHKPGQTVYSTWLSCMITRTAGANIDSSLSLWRKSRKSWLLRHSCGDLAAIAVARWFIKGNRQRTVHHIRLPIPTKMEHNLMLRFYIWSACDQRSVSPFPYSCLDLAGVELKAVCIRLMLMGFISAGGITGP